MNILWRLLTELMAALATAGSDLDPRFRDRNSAMGFAQDSAPGFDWDSARDSFPWKMANSVHLPDLCHSCCLGSLSQFPRKHHLRPYPAKDPK